MGIYFILNMSKKVFIVAEMGASHHQDYDTACNIIKAVAWAGADAVKVQMFTPDQMTLNSKEDRFIIKEGQWKGYKLYDLYEAAALPLDWIRQLKEQAKDLNLKFFATVYHPGMVTMAEEKGIERYKIASFEIPYLELVDKVAQTLKPVIISTGMAEYNEIRKVVKTVKKYHNDITLLHCVSEYPAPIEKMNLRVIPALARAFKVKSGLSDHTDGIVAPVVATALGAVIIEKHIKIDDVGLDSGFAIMPERFKVMVEIMRAAEKSLGKVSYGGEKRFRRENVDDKWLRVVHGEKRQEEISVGSHKK